MDEKEYRKEQDMIFQEIQEGEDLIGQSEQKVKDVLELLLKETQLTREELARVFAEFVMSKSDVPWKTKDFIKAARLIRLKRGFSK